MSDSELDDELLALADEEEEEDASAPGSPESLGSGAMEESDSEADAEGDDDDEGNPFPLEGKFKNEKDRTDIMAMTEVQREELLADRAAEQERRLQDLQLRKLLAQREKDEEAAKRKRKAGAADLDNSQRKASRPKTKQSENLDNYRKAREERGKQLERQRQRGGRRRSRSRSAGDESGSERDADGEEEVDWDFETRPKTKDDPLADLKDFNSCRIGRAGFAEVCFYPGFEDAIAGTYCRMNAGPKEPGSDEFIYRMMQIKGFTEMPEKPYGPYLLEWNGKKYMTDQYVIGIEGKSEKKVQFNHCSNSRILESEFQHYKTSIQNAGMRMPTRSQLESKFRDIHRLRNMKFTSDDIQFKLSKQNKYSGRLAQNAASTAKPKTSAQVMQARLEQINKDNRRRNQEEGRKAMIMERKKDMQRRAVAQKLREQKEKDDADKVAKDLEKKARLSALGKDDLFDSDVSRSNTPGISRAGTPLPPKRELKGIPTFTKKKMDDDVIASLDLDIDIDI